METKARRLSIAIPIPPRPDNADVFSTTFQRPDRKMRFTGRALQNSEWTSQGFSPSPCTARRKSPRFSPYIKRSLSRSASRDGLSSLCITQSVSPCSSPCISQSSTPVFQRDMDFSLVRMTQCATPSMLARTLRRDGAPTTPLDRAVDMYLKNDELGALIEDLQNYQITNKTVSVHRICTSVMASPTYWTQVQPRTKNAPNDRLVSDAGMLFSS
eukprot:g32385.t1